MPTTTRRRVTRQPAEKKFSKKDFATRLTQFLVNKAMIEIATLRNDGDKKKGEEGLKDRLKQEVIANGEVDPETGSYFLILDEPIDIAETGTRWKRVKAEKRQGNPYLDAEKAREFLEKKGLLDEVEEFTYTLRLPTEAAERFGEWLQEQEWTEYLTGEPTGVLVEDKLLALHQRREKVRGQKEPQRVISEEELDSLYSTPEPTYAFVPLQK